MLGGQQQVIRCDFLFLSMHILPYLYVSQILKNQNADTLICEQRILHMGIDWDTTDIRAVLLAKLGKTLMGTTRIVINSLHIKGDVCTIFLFYFSR